MSDHPTNPPTEPTEPNEPGQPTAPIAPERPTPERPMPPPDQSMTAYVAPSAETIIAQEPPRRARFHVWLIVAILALAAGGLFAWRNIAGSGSGSSTPEGAVRALFDAAQNEDTLGVLASLLPSERESFQEPLEQIRNELVRLGILSADASLSGVPGLDLRFENLTFKTTTLADGFAFVEATGGTVHSSVDPTKLPFGKFLRDTAGAALPQRRTTTSEPVADQDASMVAVQDGGKWYASIWYSVAESARRDAGAPLPSFGKGIAAQGSSSPEGAVRALVTALTKLDVRGMIALTPPDEMRALHDYASIFISAADAAASEARSHVRVQVRKLDLTSERQGAQAIVKIAHVEFAVSAADGSFSVNFDGRCFSGKGLPFEAPRICTDELAQQAPFPPRQADLGFIVVQSGGQWFISPTRTVLGAVTASLRALTPQDLDQIRQMLTGLMGFGGPRTG